MTADATGLPGFAEAVEAAAIALYEHGRGEEYRYPCPTVRAIEGSDG